MSVKLYTLIFSCKVYFALPGLLRDEVEIFPSWVNSRSRLTGLDCLRYRTSPAPSYTIRHVDIVTSHPFFGIELSAKFQPRTKQDRQARTACQLQFRSDDTG